MIKHHSMARRFVLVLALACLNVGSPAAAEESGKPAPSKPKASPLDQLSREEMLQSERDMLPDIAVGVITLEQGQTQQCEFSGDGRLADTNDKRALTIWDLTGKTPKLATSFEMSQYAVLSHSIGFSPDSKLLAIKDPVEISLWDVSGTTAKVLKSASQVGGGLLFTPDGKTLVAGGEPYRVTPRGVEPRVEKHGVQNAKVISRDGKLFLTTSGASAGNGDRYAREVMIWRTGPGRPTEYMAVTHEKSIQSLDLSPDNKRVATSSIDNYLRIWDVSGKAAKELSRTSTPTWLKQVTFTPKGNFIIGFTNQAEIKVYRTSDGVELKSWRFTPKVGTPFHGQYLGFWDVAVSPDGRHLAFTNMTTKAVVLRLPPEFADE